MKSTKTAKSTVLEKFPLYGIQFNKQYVEKFGVGQTGQTWPIWQIECPSPIFYLPITSFYNQL